jgi:hypothetical protein
MKKFEKITLLTCIDAYESTRTVGMSALDEVVELISKHATEVTLIDYDNPVEYELVKKAEKGGRDQETEVNK